MADTPLAEAMVATSAKFPPGESEVEALGLRTEPGERIKTPRLADAPIAMECRLFEIYPVGEDRKLVMGEVLLLHARDGLFNEDTKYMTVPHYDPVARLFGPGYAKLSEPYALPIPDWESLGKGASVSEAKPQPTAIVTDKA